MSFGYLPLPVFLIMFLIVSSILFYYSIKGWRNDPKTLSIGLFIFGISSLGAGVNRLVEELRIFGDRLLLINSFTFWITVIGTILLIIGSLQKVKDDPIKKGSSC